MKIFQKTNKAFTLIELLVVISIIAVLMAILLPSLSMVRKQAKKLVCGSNLRQLQLSAAAYTNSNDNKFPFQDGRGFHGNDGVKALNALNRESSDWRENWIYSLVNYGNLPKESYVCPEITSLFNREKNAVADDRGYYFSYTANGVLTHYGGRYIKRPSEVVSFMDDVYLATSAVIRASIQTHFLSRRGDPPPSPSPADAGFSGWMRFSDADLICDGPHDMDTHTARWFDEPRIEAKSSSGGNGGGRNYVFADGHVEYMKWDEISSRHFGLKINGKDQQEEDVPGYQSNGRLGYISQ
ncbi:hypothetical protein SMSP2_00184 [Limihaloglobus sulfuriphilus]|uniref:Major pilin subunit n=1 Tax=Limihaloglobus sulfuriphilus TaxID=1851148 RepID=A0A1Q2MB17_9BACT|nr:type II secretion system protein [Limihaloglobus sulfuriphilus]AQQ69850.1 hypothetical protein SMSP2_00184 [Limihaloglobus sulfuriphilus]